MKDFIIIILLLILFPISVFPDPTTLPSAPSETQNGTNKEYNIPDLTSFFNSYNQSPSGFEKTKNDSLLCTITSIYNNFSKSTLVNPYEIEINKLPDSILIDCHDYIYPTKSQHITSRFGIRGIRFHNGIDIGIKYGDTIRSPFAGVVRYSNYQRGGYGKYIIIRHHNGLETIMAHFSHTLVSVGDTLLAGDVVGLGGSSGRSSGPHLHLEFRLLGNSFNPEKIINFKNTEIKNRDNKGNFLITIADTYSHQGDLEEIKRAAYHRVRSGETLSHIARRYGTSIRRLCALNGIKETSVIRIGQRIRYR